MQQPLGGRGGGEEKKWKKNGALTQHDENGGALLVARRVGGVLAGEAAGVRHAQVGNADGRVLQVVV